MKQLALILIALLPLIGVGPANAIQAAFTLEVHQDIEEMTANDFHVEGTICSRFGPPTLISHTDGPFTNFTHAITKADPTNPEDCWYTFRADWSGTAPIFYCTVIQLGLVFDEAGSNIIVDLVGWWTRNGERIGDIIQGLGNNGYVPLTGFQVTDDTTSPGQRIRVTNGLQPNVPPPSTGAPRIPIEIIQMDLISFPAGSQPPIGELKIGGEQDNWRWIPVTNRNGAVISPTNPLPMQADSFFDVFFELPQQGEPGVLPEARFTIPADGFLVSRTKMRFTNNAGNLDELWHWDIHQAPVPCSWKPGDAYKWLQMPDVTSSGVDIRVDSDDGVPRVLADDFKCTQTGPITDVHFWGSWLNDIKGEIENIHLSLHSDIPAGPNGEHSRPGDLLWQGDFGPGMFTESLYATLPADLFEWWWDPVTGVIQSRGDQNVWQYDICIPEQMAYTQRGTTANPIIYWLDIQVRLKPGATQQPRFGWKTRDWNPDNLGGGRFNDDAVWGTGTDCVAQDNGFGTANLPPPCPYDGSMQIIDGLEAGSAIEIDTEIGGYSNQFEVPGGSFPGGKKQTYNALMPLDMTGTGGLAGYTRLAQMLVQVETHSAPRMPGDPIQSFDTDMFLLQGQLPPGDPDFDLLRITAGTGFIMPSPGHTTLTQQLGGNWAVDSFFDITYRIDFIGAPGSVLAGKSGSSMATVRFQIADLWNELKYPRGHPLHPQSLDMAFVITGTTQPQEEWDFGDAPDSYVTKLPNGARHQIVPGMMMGNLIDAEGDGQPNANATGDDIAALPDEDGVTLSKLARGCPAVATIFISAPAGTPGMIDAWIDWANDGTFATPGDQILASVPVVPGANNLKFWVPATASLGSAFARFRYSTTRGLSYMGPASDGEVEDYMVKINPSPVIVNKGKAKLLPVGTEVLIQRDVVTANFGQVGWYFEEPERMIGTAKTGGRFAGLGVLGEEPWAINDMVTCYGQTVLVGCELMLNEYASILEGSGLITPLGQTNKGSGGGAFGNQPGLMDILLPATVARLAVGLNSVALLVKLWGRCTCIEETTGGPVPIQSNFWIDDGSNLWDGTLCPIDQRRALGVKVRVPDGYAGPPIVRGAYYAVVGIMRASGSPFPTDECVRWLWPRMDTDIQPIPEP